MAVSTGGAGVGGNATGGRVSTTGGAPVGVGGNATGGLLATGGNAASVGGGNNQTGGAIGAGGNPAVGGAPATGGEVGASTTNVDISYPAAPSDSGGCGCRVAGERSNSRPLALLGMLGMLAFGTLRRRPKN